MAQPSGVYLVELQWVNGAGQDWHVVTINCDGRYTFCNALGYVPFSAKGPETPASHDEVAALYQVRRVSRVWCILKVVK